jgi:hypothetical protein
VQTGARPSLAFSLPLPLLKEWTSDDMLADAVDWNALPDTIHFGCAHWPVPEDRLPGAAWLNIHGHTHQRSPYTRHINVSVESIGYAPRMLSQLVTVEMLDNLTVRPRPSGIEESVNYTVGR